MKLKITFGLNLDGVLYPAGVNNLNEARFGANGFLSFLEGRSGIVYKEAPFEAGRIIAYQNAMRELEETGDKFYSASFSEMIDAWASAEILLSWRDSLIMGGWDGLKDFPDNKRLHTIFELEKADGFKTGFADRLLCVLKVLPDSDLDIESVQLETPFNLLPYLWQKIFTVLKSKGISVSESQESGKQAEVIFLSSDNELIASEVIAEWLCQSENDNKKPLLITNGQNALLNNALKKRKLPALENDTASPLRSLLQVLPTVIDLMEKPLLPQKLYDFLRLPATPLGKNAIRLSHALEKMSGIGNEVWNKALKKCTDEDPDIEWNYWLNLAQYEDVVPTAALLTCCDKLEVWLKKAPYYELRPAALKQLFDFREVLSLYNSSEIKFSQVRKILRSVLNAIENPFEKACQSGPYYMVNSPAKILAAPDVAIWADFRDNSGFSAVYPWTIAEEKALRDAQIFPDTRENAAERSSLEYQNALKAKTLIISLLKTDKGDMFHSHPFGDKWEKKEPLVEVSLKNDIIKLKEKEIKIAKTALPANTKKDLAIGGITENPKHSASSMQMFIDCPLEWYFNYELGLTDSMASMQNEYLALGKLVHKVFEKLCDDKSLASWTKKKVKTLFENLVAEQAAFLNDARRTAEKETVLKQTLNAVEKLKLFIEENRLSIVDAEEPLPAEEFKGSIDMHLKQGNKDLLLDMKYSSNKKYSQALKKGEALQLALYAKAVGAKVAGYFLLKSNEIFLNTDGFEHAITKESDLAETWEKMSELADENLALLKAGSFTPEYKKDICEHCAFSTLCGVNDEI